MYTQQFHEGRRSSVGWGQVRQHYSRIRLMRGVGTSAIWRQQLALVKCTELLTSLEKFQQAPKSLHPFSGADQDLLALISFAWVRNGKSGLQKVIISIANIKCKWAPMCISMPCLIYFTDVSVGLHLMPASIILLWFFSPFQIILPYSCCSSCLPHYQVVLLNNVALRWPLPLLSCFLPHCLLHSV